MQYDGLMRSDRLPLGTPTTAGLLRQLREQRGRSLRAAANDLNVAPSHLSRLERGEKSGGEGLLRRMAKYYGVEEDLVALAEGRVPEDVLAILQARPDLLDLIREKAAKPSPTDGRDLPP